MSRPPHSSAYPDTGGVPVPPFPQLIHQTQSQQNQAGSSDSRMTPGRRNSGGPARPSSAPIQQQPGYQPQPGGSHGYGDLGSGLIKPEGGFGPRPAQPHLHTLARGRHGSGSLPSGGPHP